MESTRLAYFPKAEKAASGAREAERPVELSTEAGDFWRLADPHKRKLYNFIHKSLFFSEEADDVFQETLLRGWKYFGSYNREKDFGTWLFAIAHNEVKRHFRYARRGSPLPLDDRLIIRDEGGRQELVREIYRFAERLKPRHREIFFLFYDSGFSLAEISRITGVREGNAKFILNRARNFLRTSLGEPNGKS